MKHGIISSVLASALLLCASTAFARHPPRQRALPRQQPTSLEQAVKQVQHDTRGHILAADTVSRDRTQVYRIKVLKPDGQVQVMQLHSSEPLQTKSGETDSDQGGH